MATIYQQAKEYATTTPFEERAKRFFLLDLDHVKAILLGEEPSEALMDDLEMVWLTFDTDQINRMNEMGASTHGMVRFVCDKIGVDPTKPVIRNEHGAFINAVAPEEATEVMEPLTEGRKETQWVVFLAETGWLGGINGHSVPRESAHRFASEDDADMALELRRDKKRAFDGGEYPDAFVELAEDPGVKKTTPHIEQGADDEDDVGYWLGPHWER